MKLNEKMGIHKRRRCLPFILTEVFFLSLFGAILAAVETIKRQIKSVFVKWV